jgi:hypothetical protein
LTLFFVDFVLWNKKKLYICLNQDEVEIGLMLISYRF